MRNRRKDGATWYINCATGSAHSSADCRGLSGSKARLEVVFVPWGVKLGQVDRVYFRRYCGWCT
jgi:hypothetical protein